jgi:hypothetical protein
MSLLVDKVPQEEVEPQTTKTPPFFFHNYEDSTKITGINKDLLKRCAVILQALSFGFQTNTTDFPEYALETATQYVQEHSWFYTPVSVHKILIYRSEIISATILPNGLPSDEVQQESRNKDLKHFR